MERAATPSVERPLLDDLSGLPPTLTVPHAGRLVGLGRDAAYRAAAAGELPTIKFGRRLFVLTARLLELLGVSAGSRS